MLVKVMVENTGVETVVSLAYYEKYKTEGLRFMGEYHPDEGAVAPVPVSEENKLSYQELKDELTIAGATFNGNAPKAKLVELLKELKAEKE